MTGVKITLDRNAVKRRIEQAGSRGLFILSNEVLKDANFYAKEDTSELIKSSLRASKPETGLLVWDTPYAKRQYYTGSPSKDTNPNASLMWAHKAVAENKKKYVRMMQRILEMEV